MTTSCPPEECASPYVKRLRSMWTVWRETVIEHFPASPGQVADCSAYMHAVARRYKADAFNSLSIEGYSVTHDLLERVAVHELPLEEYLRSRDAMAARGYFQAFGAVQDSIRKILNGQNAGLTAAQDHRIWYENLFAPSVASGNLQRYQLAGYRTGPVYIRNSMHAPLPRHALLDAMEELFRLVSAEPEASVRAVLGHHLFVFVHPYFDGNGRIGRLLMTALALLASPNDPAQQMQVDSRSALGIGLAASIKFSSAEGSTGKSLFDTANSTIAAINARADEAHLRVNVQLRLVDEAQRRANDAWDTHVEDYGKLVTSFTQQVQSALQGASKEITEFRTKYAGEIALKEPVMFWKDKGAAHTRRARYFGVAAVVSAVAIALGAVRYLPELLRPATGATVNLSTVPNPSALTSIAQASASYPGAGVPSYYGIALAIVLTTLAMWFLRVMVRNYFSQTHLATDAEERVAMVKTYLALMESGQAPNDSLAPVLTALFRPASDGIVKDDSMPVGITEILTKQRS